MNGFRLISLQLLGSEFEGLSFIFSDEKKHDFQLPYTSLLIGPNGTGKTRLLKIIIEIFNDIFLIKTRSQHSFKFSNDFILEYRIDRNRYVITHAQGEFNFRKNDTSPKTINEIEIPNKAIVASYGIYEKFPVKEINPSFYVSKPGKFDNHFYEYLGLKTNKNMIFSSGYINRTIDLIIEALSDNNFKKNLKGVFDTLKFLPELKITYRVRQKELFQEKNPNQKALFDFLDNRDSRTIGFVYNKLKNLSTSNEEQQKIVFQSIKQVRKLMTSASQIEFSVSFVETADNQKLIEAFESLSVLRKIGLLNYETIKVFKQDKYGKRDYDIKQLSSGETQVLTSLLALSSVVEDNSVILIDEPEISMHPNWQIQYVDLLNTIFNSYPTCHFIVASHSHFLASDLRPETSSIVSLKFDDSLQLKAETLNYDTYGWSAENILYTVFGVSTTRNYYFESDINELLALLQDESSDHKRISDLVMKFKKFKLTESDPLNLIISDATKYLSRYGFI